jgi:hypothetical protein
MAERSDYLDLHARDRSRRTRNPALFPLSSCGTGQKIGRPAQRRSERYASSRPARLSVRRQSVARVRHSPFLLHRDRVRGLVYDVDTGVLREIERKLAWQPCTWADVRARTPCVPSTRDAPMTEYVRRSRVCELAPAWR